MRKCSTRRTRRSANFRKAHLDIKPIAIQATLDEIANTDPGAKQMTAQQLIDRRFLAEMEKDGTFDRLGLK